TGTFAEVELGFSEEMAREEAQRCLNCAGCSSCMECVKACGLSAIKHDMKDEIEEIDVGALVVATGYDVFDPTLLSEYGYGRYKDVVTSMEFERMCYSGGPTSGELVRLSTGEPLKSVVFVQCAGSRDKHRGKNYCSKTCCMYTAKHVMLMTEKIPGARPYIFYMDVRTPGKGYDEFYRRAAEERGAKYIRGRVAKVYPYGGKLLVKGEDTLSGRPVEVEADMVVLATPMVAQADAIDLARRLSVTTDQDGFFTEAHPKLRPCETNTSGIFLAGACQGPKDIPESVAQASAAAAKVCTILSKEEWSVSPMVSAVDEELCSGCMHCEMVCPYRAISEKTVPERILGKTVQRKVATVNKGVCQGCGACTVACRTGAMNLAGFANEEIMSEVDALCTQKTPAVV
ncbi:MAG: 4Fe-4S binding protein, partial [Bacillota bacterium]